VLFAPPVTTPMANLMVTRGGIAMVSDLDGNKQPYNSFDAIRWPQSPSGENSRSQEEASGHYSRLKGQH
jgi:hypothetical protein